jgi:hypothetical protein
MSLYPEWEASHKDDAPQLPERIRVMHGANGHGQQGVTCKHCKHLYHHLRFLKCDLNKMTRGPGTDWRAGWPACGKFEMDNPGVKA